MSYFDIIFAAILLNWVADSISDGMKSVTIDLLHFCNLYVCCIVLNGRHIIYILKM